MVHGIKKNMPNKLMNLKEKMMLRKRNIIETVFDYLKNKMNLEHTRHRSPINAFVHILSTFISYCLKTNKPSINWNFDLSLNYNLIPNWGKLRGKVLITSNPMNILRLKLFYGIIRWKYLPIKTIEMNLW